METVALPSSPRLRQTRRRPTLVRSAPSPSPQRARSRSRSNSPAPFGDRCQEGYTYVESTRITPRTPNKYGKVAKAYTRRAYCTPAKRKAGAYAQALGVVLSRYNAAAGKTSVQGYRRRFSEANAALKRHYRAGGANWDGAAAAALADLGVRA